MIHLQNRLGLHVYLAAVEHLWKSQNRSKHKFSGMFYFVVGVSTFANTLMPKFHTILQEYDIFLDHHSPLQKFSKVSQK